jgi:phage shock protein E
MKQRFKAAIAVDLICAALAGCGSVPRAPAAQGDARYEDAVVLQDLITNGPELYILIDVRTPEEYLSGHIPTAINIPYDAMAARVPTPDRSQLIIVYCRTGGRAAAAKETLDSMGYLRVVNFGGISKWSGELNTTSLPGECPCRDKQRGS